MDKYFFSLNYFDYLIKKKLTVVGNVTLNTKAMPRGLGDEKLKTWGDLTVTWWMDKKRPFTC